MATKKNLIESAISKVKGFFDYTILQGLAQVASNPTLNRVANELSSFNKISSLPRMTLPKPQVQNKAAQSVINLGMAIPESIVNIPRNYLVGTVRTGKEIGESLVNKRPISLQNLASGAAPLAESIFDVGTLGLTTIGKGLVKEGGKQVIKGGLKQAIKTGVMKGSGYGGFGGLTYGLDLQYGKEFDPWEVIKSVGAGIILGGLVGGGASGVGALKKLVTNPPEVVNQLRDKAGRWVAGEKLVKPQLMTNAQWDFQLKFNKKYNRNPYDPVFPDDLAKVARYEAEKRAGLQVRDINKDKFPLGKPQVAKEVPTQPKGVGGIGELIISSKGGKVKLRIKPIEELPQINAMRKVTLETKPKSQISTGLSTKPQVQPASQKIALKTRGASGIEVSAPSKPLKSRTSTDIVSQKYVGNINLNRLNLTPKEKQAIKVSIETLQPTLEKAKGRTLSHAEVLAEAKKSEILTKITTRDETLAAEASLLKARQRLVELDKNITSLVAKGNTAKLRTEMADLVDSLRVVSSSAADAGRKLESFAIGAEDQSVRQLLLKEIGKTEKNTARIVEEATKVNWDDANSITAFYRKFVKPSIMEVLDEFRYNNMLSNPRTHIRNAFSNMVQTFVTRPATLAFQGKPIEATKYYTGAIKSFPNAVDAFVKSFKGTKAIEKPDIAHIGTGRLPGVMTIPTRAMEAADKFFSTIIEGGELARGATAKEAAKTAEYSLFRQGLFPEGQGKLLNAIDSVTAWTYKAPKAVRWFVPFIRTPMNFAKQWLEYSPVGVATTIGVKNAREQLGKAILGSTITAIGAKFALEGNTTWDIPTDPKQKELFYASGRKPFSVKVGDKWVSMMYAGPFAMAFALPAAMKYYQDESRTALTDTQLEKAGSTVMSMARFLSGQTFLEGINNFVKFFSGDADYSVAGNLAFTAGQIIPMEGLVRWITTLVDPIYRKGTTFGKGIKKNIPFLSQTLEPYTTPTGEPSKRERLNLVTPYDISTNVSSYEPMLERRTEKLQQNAIENKVKKDIEASQGGTQVVNNKYFYWDEESASTKTLSLDFSMPKLRLTGDRDLDEELLADFKGELTTLKNNAMKAFEVGAIDQKQVMEVIKRVGSIKEALKAPKKIKIKQPKFVPLKISKAKKITGLTKKKRLKLIRPKKLKEVKL